VGLIKLATEHSSHIPKLIKDAGDTLSLGGFITYIMGMLTPFFEFLVIVLTSLWFFLRIIDLSITIYERLTKKGGN
jgi:uncharacterized membrane protein